MKDINGMKISIGAKIEDFEGRKYLITEKDNELYAKALFNDSGCSEYILYQEIIIRNGFKLIN